MSNRKPQVPTIQLPLIIDELNRINGQVFNLKQGVKLLIQGIEKGATVEELKVIVEISGMAAALDALEMKDY